MRPYSFFLLVFLCPALLFCKCDVERLLEERINGGGGTGIVVGIVDGPNVEIFSYGQLSTKNAKKVDERTLFEIGSLTKIFTTILLEEKVLQGEISLSDPVQRYLPEGFFLPERNGKAITFQHLATHTSGLPYCPTNHVVQSISNPYASYTKKEFDDFFQQYQLTRDPGERYEYSNVGIGLLGNLLADLEGVDYETLVTTHICQKLGMQSTVTHLTSDMFERLARPHLGKSEVDLWDFPAFPAAGALHSCVQDLLIFLRANMGQINTPLTNPMAYSHQKICQSDNPEEDVGLGWAISHRFLPEIVWHNGGTGGYRSFLGFCKSRQRGVVILTNSTTRIEDIGFHLIDERYPLEATCEKILLDPVVLQGYEGKYHHWLGLSCMIYQSGGQLYVQAKGFPDALALPLAENRFFFQGISAQIAFESNSSGERIMIVTYGNQRYVFKRCADS